VLTGATSLESLLPLLTRYLATIPAAEGRGGRRDPRTLTPLPFRFPEQPVVEDVEVSVCGCVWVLGIGADSSHVCVL
jgi:hypothetical protein